MYTVTRDKAYISKIKTLNEEIEILRARYKEHFKSDIPDKIIGWWDPMRIGMDSYPEDLEKGVKNMTRDIDTAIRTNEPIESIPDDIWETIIF